MRYRKLGKVILAAVLAIPIATSCPDPGVKAQEEAEPFDEEQVTDLEEWELPGGSNLIMEDVFEDSEDQKEQSEEGLYASDE